MCVCVSHGHPRGWRTSKWFWNIWLLHPQSPCPRPSTTPYPKPGPDGHPLRIFNPILCHPVCFGLLLSSHVQRLQVMYLAFSLFSYYVPLTTLPILRSLHKHKQYLHSFFSVTYQFLLLCTTGIHKYIQIFTLKNRRYRRRKVHPPRSSFIYLETNKVNNNSSVKHS